ncbi:MAG: IgA Peptidase M64 [Bacteroidales bacterium]|nr:IgA Peptidase M64 [Bacteroidales bacterium]
MKYINIIIFCLIGVSGFSQNKYNQFFTENSLRVDFLFSGNSKAEHIFLNKLKKEPFWGGSRINLVDTFNYGKYKFEVIDKASSSIIFSKGFCTLFEEWQTITEAKTLNKAMPQTINLPYPKKEVVLKLYSRNKNGIFKQVFELEINPKNYFINPEKYFTQTEKLIDNGESSQKIDLAFIAEGYTTNEMNKFKNDVLRLVKYMFSVEPFKKYRKSFNIWLIKSESNESGTDIPKEKIYRKTILNSSFYTFNSERYLMTEDYFTVKDIASTVPYDNICIIVNSKKYGGGGIYNYYCISSADHKLSSKVFVHEFGHSFAGLADEYYTSSTAYNNFFNLEIEPWQPNLTTLVNFSRKWNTLIDKSTPIPTPRDNKYSNTIGVYEGGGYVNKGMYSPYMDCRMKSNQTDSFCPICQQAIEKIILFKTK